MLFSHEDHRPSSGTSPCGNVIFIYNATTIQQSVQELDLVTGNMDDSDQTQVCVDILCCISIKNQAISSYLGMKDTEHNNDLLVT